MILLNGRLMEAREASLPVSNRAFRYGDGLFETMKAQNGQLLYSSDHWQRLNRGMEYLSMELPEAFSEEAFHGMATDLCKANGLRDARVRCEIWRNGEGRYLPESNTVSWLMEAEALPQSLPASGKTGIRLGIFPEYRIPVVALSSLKTCNRLPNVMAALFAAARQWDDCILLNENGNAAEATASNVFMVRTGMIYTPATDEGCIPGVMRNQVIRLARSAGMVVHEQAVSPAMLAGADEIFVTNVIRGIVPCIEYEGTGKKTDVSAMLRNSLPGR